MKNSCSNLFALITGATGQLGRDLVAQMEVDFEVTGVGGSDFDITDQTETEEFITELQPDIIIHSAAYTDVDGCEKNEDKAFRVNGLGARNVAIAARKVGARLVYISTDYVFDGEKDDLYREYDKTNPQSIYGNSKLLGEQFVREQIPEHYICRIAWLYGQHGDNFVKTMVKLAEEKEEISVVNDQFGNPTWTQNVARQIKKLITTNAFGTYHCTSQGVCSWYQFAIKVFEEAGYRLDNLRTDGVNIVNNKGKKTLVKPVPSEQFNRPAPRPENSDLENYMLQLQDLDIMPRWEESLKEFLGSNKELI